MSDHLIGWDEASAACDTDARTLRRWLSDDGTPVRRDGVHWLDLKKALARRDRPFPPQLISGPRILLADDEPDLLLVLVEALSAASDRPLIATARDGRAALRKLGSFRPDLLITDLEMPLMGGLELCRLARQDPALADLRIIAITGFDCSPRHRAALDGGADSYLVKPFANEELRAEVSRLLKQPRRRRYEDPAKHHADGRAGGRGGRERGVLFF